MTWEVQPEFQPFLATILSLPAAEIKKTTDRSVHRIEFQGNHYYLKRTFHRGNLLASAAFFLSAPRTRKDWHLSRTLARLGVPVAPMLAYGERWDWHGLIETALISLGPPGFVSLHQLNEPPGPEIQRSLGRFLRSVHDKGVALRDLHTKNILYSPSEQRFCLIDLDTVSLGISRRTRLDHLARLHSRLPLTQAFFEGYGAEYAGCAAEIARHAAFIRHKRCLKENFDFQKRICGSIRWHVRTTRWNRQLEELLQSPEHFLSGVAGRSLVLKRSSSSIITQVDDLILKGYPPRTFPAAVKDLLRPSRAKRAFKRAYHLELAGIPTARPIAVGTSAKGALGWSYFIMEAIPDAFSLWSWKGEKRQVARRVAELVARLHESGFTHRDLKDTNILLDRSGNPHLIDMEGIRFLGRVGTGVALSNLARLGRTAARIKNLTARDKVRFVIHYCRCRGWNNWREIWPDLNRRVAALPPPRLEENSGTNSDPSSAMASDEPSWIRLQPGSEAYVRAGWKKLFESAGMRTLDDFLRVAGEPLSKPGLGNRYRARLRLWNSQNEEIRVYLKRFSGEALGERVKRRFEDGLWHSAAERELHAAEGLSRSGIPVPQPLAWGRTGSGTDLRSFVVFAGAAGQPVPAWLQQRKGSSASAPGRMRTSSWIEALARIAQRFHASGWRHRDFYLCHWFIEETEEGPRFTIIDLQRVFRPRFRPERWRIKDLAQLHFSAAEAGLNRPQMLRFLLAYCSQSRLDADSKKLARRILRKSRRIG